MKHEIFLFSYKNGYLLVLEADFLDESLIIKILKRNFVKEFLDSSKSNIFVECFYPPLEGIKKRPNKFHLMLHKIMSILLDGRLIKIIL